MRILILRTKKALRVSGGLDKRTLRLFSEGVGGRRVGILMARLRVLLHVLFAAVLMPFATMVVMVAVWPYESEQAAKRDGCGGEADEKSGSSVHTVTVVFVVCDVDGCVCCSDGHSAGLL